MFVSLCHRCALLAAGRDSVEKGRQTGTSGPHGALCCGLSFDRHRIPFRYLGAVLCTKRKKVSSSPLDVVLLDHTGMVDALKYYLYSLCLELLEPGYVIRYDRGDATVGVHFGASASAPPQEVPIECLQVADMDAAFDTETLTALATALFGRVGTVLEKVYVRLYFGTFCQT